ncbi:hypothetical protein EYF80_013114 [Liparis tanakae]|uniref:Uncharacterized protein n=1 Tax=Liparis tanakae TaxID=230148 RepID=A0A4Z2IH52_9TELE|nr:hypothetical protein EYF80_013114 [Liparis tanakae]
MSTSSTPDSSPCSSLHLFRPPRPLYSAVGSRWRSVERFAWTRGQHGNLIQALLIIGLHLFKRLPLGGATEPWRHNNQPHAASL